MLHLDFISAKHYSWSCFLHVAGHYLQFTESNSSSYFNRQWKKCYQMRSQPKMKWSRQAIRQLYFQLFKNKLSLWFCCKLISWSTARLHEISLVFARLSRDEKWFLVMEKLTVLQNKAINSWNCATQKLNKRHQQLNAATSKHCWKRWKKKLWKNDDHNSFSATQKLIKES